MKIPDSISRITPAGAVEPIETPTFLLSRDEACVLRDYVIWLEYRQMRVKLWCKACWDKSNDPTEIDINPNAIGVMCEHQLVIYIGDLPRITRQYENSDLVWAPKHEGLLIANEVPTVMMSDAESKILRDYKKLLEAFHLLEGMYCNTCWDSSHHDGCRATVTTGAIDILCRHRHLKHRGTLATH